MRGNRIRSWLIALFACGQLLLGLHAAQHQILGPDHPDCEICTVAHAPPVPAVPLAFAPAVLPPSMPVAAMAAVHLDRRPFARPHNRGPPSSLA